MVRESVLSGYYYVLFHPFSWLVIVLWHLAVGSAIYLISRKIAGNKSEVKRLAFFSAKYTGLGLCFEILKSFLYTVVIYYLICALIYFCTGMFGAYNNELSELLLEQCMIVYDVSVMIAFVLLTVGFGFLTYFFVLRKYDASKKHRIVLSIILSLISGAYILPYVV